MLAVRIKLLGEGSFGRVFLMREKRPGGGRLVCVKEIHNVHRSSSSIPHGGADTLCSDATEVRLMKKLRHPNLIRFLDAFPGTKSKSRTKSTSCIVMEFCSGGDLRSYLRRQHSGGGGPGELGKARHRTEDMIWFWFLQLCLGLHHMHQLQVLHRDVKTANIFLSNAGFLVLGDFGIARELRADELAATVIGTPLYMAPETLEGEPYSFASDIWSLGCVLYEMCTGEPPFSAKTMPLLVNKICGGSFTPLSRTKFSSRLQDLVAAMLQVKSSVRPSAAGILADPSMHAHLKRYFHDRCTLSVGSSGGRECKEDLSMLVKQLQSLGVPIDAMPNSVSPTIAVHTTSSEKLDKLPSKPGSRLRDDVEAKLLAEREFERRQQLLAGLEKLQRLRLQKLDGCADQHNEIGDGDANQAKPTAKPLDPLALPPAFPCFRGGGGVESEMRWRDPVQNRPRSSERTPVRDPSSSGNSLTKISAFLGIPRKGVPLTVHAKEYANRSPVCKDVRVLRQLERTKAAEAYKKQLERDPPARRLAPARAAYDAAPRVPRSIDDDTERQTDAAIAHSIHELQAALHRHEVHH